MAREPDCSVARRPAGRELPLRVTHNDTKSNNVLWTAGRGSGSVIDLDTVCRAWPSRFWDPYGWSNHGRRMKRTYPWLALIWIYLRLYPGFLRLCRLSDLRGVGISALGQN
jgi:hypothetical protein